MKIHVDGDDASVAQTFGTWLHLATSLTLLPGAFLSRCMELQIMGGKPDKLRTFLEKNPFDIFVGPVWSACNDETWIRLWVGSEPSGLPPHYRVALGDEGWQEGLWSHLGMIPPSTIPEWEDARVLASKLFNPMFQFTLNVASSSSWLLILKNEELSPIGFRPVSKAPTAVALTDGEVRRFQRRLAPFQIVLRIEYESLVAKHCDPYIREKHTDLVVSTNSYSSPIPHEYVGGVGSWISPDTPLTLSSISKPHHLSLVASGKSFLPGHKLRHRVVGRLAERFGIHVMGRKYKPFHDKADAHLPFRYSIVIENSKTANFLTEKLTDCLRCGCVAIYWGAVRVDKYYDMGSIIEWSSVPELETILSRCSVEDFESRREAIQRNMYLAESRLTFGRCLALDTSLMWRLAKMKEESSHPAE